MNTPLSNNISIEYLNQFKGDPQIELICYACNLYFIRKKSQINKTLKRNQPLYCSTRCMTSQKSIKYRVPKECSCCSKKITVRLGAIKKSNTGRFFCNHSCATTYNNKNKTHGNRRSKLEVYLEEQIQLHYPELNCEYNKHKAIDSELDFYFPTLKLAIELNGIFHYEPIYGQDKLNKIQNNDKQKSILCNENGIEFCTIDSSKCKHLTQSHKDEYWSIVNNLIKNIYNRHI